MTRFQRTARLSLIGAGFLACCGLFIAWQLASAERQRDVVAELDRVGAYAAYDYQREHLVSHDVDSVQSIVPPLLLETFGKDAFHRVFHVRLYDIDASPETLNDVVAQVVRLRRLEELFLNSHQLRDEALEPLRHMLRLEKLTIYASNLSDAGFAHLTEISGLKSISLFAPTQLSNEGVIKLARISSLCSIEIQGPHACAEGLNALRAARPGVLVNDNGNWGQ